MGVPLIDHAKMEDIWSTQRRHLRCIQDPPGVELYTKWRELTKGGVVLPVYRCARGSTSLESFHLHQCRFIPGEWVCECVCVRMSQRDWLTSVPLPSQARLPMPSTSRFTCWRAWWGGMKTASELQWRVRPCDPPPAATAPSCWAPSTGWARSSWGWRWWTTSPSLGSTQVYTCVYNIGVMHWCFCGPETTFLFFSLELRGAHLFHLEPFAARIKCSTSVCCRMYLVLTVTVASSTPFTWPIPWWSCVTTSTSRRARWGS